MATTITPSTATPVAEKTAINLTVAGAPANTATGYNTANYPASPAIKYYISINKSGTNSLVSNVFTPDSVNGAYVWPSVTIPAAGTWTAQLRRVSDNVSVANATITAS